MFVTHKRGLALFVMDVKCKKEATSSAIEIRLLLDFKWLLEGLDNHCVRFVFSSERIAILYSFDHSKYFSSSRRASRVTLFKGPLMGVGASLLTPFCLVGTGFCMALSKFSIGLLLPLTCEVAHNIAGRLLYSEGNLKIEAEIHNALNWTVVEFGIRCFSLNFCGKFNHLFDTLRRCLAPLSAGRSGRMIHDVIVVHIEDSQTGCQAFVLFSKTHNGDMEVKYCRDLSEVDDKGRPRVFGRPPCGWWKQRAKSHSLILKDVLDEFRRIPAQYQPVTNNCHHFSKDLWNWHDAKLNEGVSEADKNPFTVSKDRIWSLQWPRRRLRVNKDFPSLISQAEIIVN